MKQWEIFAARRVTTVQALSELMHDADLNAFTKGELLCRALPTGLKELARGLYRNLVLMKRPEGGTPIGRQIQEELARLRRLELERPLAAAMAILPSYSVGLEFTFTLARPYLSRDDDAFYIIDNPVRKDKVFKVPYLAPTSWKGSLRAVATRMLGQKLVEVVSQTPEARESREARDKFLWPCRAQGVLLFGQESEAQARYLNNRLAEVLLPRNPEASPADLARQRSKKRDELKKEFDHYLQDQGYRTERIEGRQGRLFFLPTYFNDLGLEIINPHDRRQGVGTNPILYECVPAGAQGRFGVLYVPYDFASGEGNSGGSLTPNRDTLIRQLTEDLPFLAEAVRDLFLTYGFGAKTSSGYGVAADSLPVPGKLLLQARLPGSTEEFRLPDQLQSLLGPNDSLDDFLDAAGNLRSQEDYTQMLQQRGADLSRKKRQLYNKVKEWWEAEGKTKYREHQVLRQARFSSVEFSRLSELPAKARELAGKLQSGGEI